MTAPLERTVNPQDLDPQTVRLLPYSFAKSKGVLAARVKDNALEVWIRPYPAASTLAEVRRMAGKAPKQFASVNQIDCRQAGTIYTAEAGAYRVQKVKLQ